MRTNIIVATIAVGMLLMPSLSEAKKKRKVLEYSGKLVDERGGPIGGVFPLTFALYSKPRGGTPFWKEKHFVGVDNGEYVIQLGRKVRIPSRKSLDQVYVGVRITGGPALVRERFVAEGGANEEVIHQAKNVAVSAGGTKAKGGVVDYAEKSGFAYVAEKAENASKLEGLTLEKLKKKLGGGGAGGKITLGDNTFNAPTAGGDGGTLFQQLCPDGYVVTGLRGGAGLYIDRVGIICSPLSSK